MKSFLLYLAILTGPSFAQSDAPSFEAAGVLPSGGDRAIPLAPGLLMSIYGHHFGPPAACQGNADPQHRETPNPFRPHQMFDETLIYPKALCETRVLVGGVPAGLLYVQERQINFKVPQETPVEGTVEIQVVYKGQSSRPVKLQGALVYLETPAKVGMPVWLKVSTGVHYPKGVHPADFGCDEVEVRRNGKLLPRIATLSTQAFDGIIGSGSPCGGFFLASHHTDRIPLHLQYRFDQPGIYEVRHTVRNPFLKDAPHTIDPPWTPIEILPGTPTERTKWLKELSARAPSDAADLLTDFLPSILGIPDRESLDLLCGYLYHPDRLVRKYAMYGLTYWPDDEAGKVVVNLARTRGPSDVSVRFLLHRRQLSADPVIEAAIPYLRSDSPIFLRGAVTAFYQTGVPEHALSPAIRVRAETALIEAADHIVSAGDDQLRSDYAATLGMCRDDRAGAVLWNLINRDVAREQAAIALTWRHMDADLPKLAQLAQNIDIYGLPYGLRRGYGEAAIPYLETMLERSKFTRVRTASAQELMLAGRPKGFAFMVDAMENNQPYRLEMLQFARDHFPELRETDDAATLNFLKARAAPK